MKKPLLGMLVVSLAVVTVVGFVGRARHGAPDAGDGRLVADRIWIDHVPRSDRDTFQAFAAVSAQAVGAFQAASAWRGSYELFRFEASGGELRLVYPQTGEREAVRAKARRCNEHGLDFCLELEGASRGVKRYYSKEGWEIRGVGDGDARAAMEAVQRRVEAIRAQLAAE
ncbi:MAG TPA: hypothetical protein VFK02_30840 [Kofleriaceae bacterium]|nr:hypothetical protein [Kofleriaceae bacterium]